MINTVIIDKEVISRCKKYKIDGEHIGTAMFILESIYEKYINEDLIKTLDDDGKDFSMYSLYKSLEVNGVIKEDEDSFKLKWLLTDAGYDLVIWYISYKEKILNNESNNIKEKTNQPVKEWVEEWRELWRDRRGVFIKDPSGRSLGTDKKNAINKLTTFIDHYDYLFENHEPKDLIIKATKKYLDEYKKANYAFAKLSANFISKREDRTKDSQASLLATECENILNSKDAPKKRFNAYKKST